MPIRTRLALAALPTVAFSIAFAAAFPIAARAQCAAARESFADRDELAGGAAALGEARGVGVRAPAQCRAGAATTCDVMLVLDADLLFPLAVAYAHVMEGMGRMSPIILVGVPSVTMEERYRNFTTAVSDEDRLRVPGAEGGPRFLRFLEAEAMPAVAAAYRPSARRALVGHSLAGLFAVDALTAGASFDSYVAISASIHINRQSAIERLIPVLDRPTGEARRLFVSVANDGQPAIDAFTRLFQEYDRRRPVWLATSFQRFRAEDHVTTVPPAIAAAMNWLYLQRAP
jgi:predicted alpha/beta superfamily hydrolase